jgi:uncharacterized cupin superfamily protein
MSNTGGFSNDERRPAGVTGQGHTSQNGHKEERGPVVNVRDLAFARELKHGDKFDCKIAPASPLLGARRLGYNLTSVAPGKRAFPFHNHHANEELFFVLEGEGSLRFGPRTVPVGPGDLIACPPGGPDVAHQLVNTGTGELRYLAISTTIDTDVVQYPDSGKFGAVGGRLPGKPFTEAPFSGVFIDGARVDYWHGE